MENSKELGIPDHLTCLLRNLYAGQEARVRTGHGTTDWFQIKTGVHQGCISLPCFFNLYAEYIMRNAGLDEAQAGIKIQFSSVTQSCLTLFNPMNCSTPGLPVHHQVPESMALFGYLAFVITSLRFTLRSHPSSVSFGSRAFMCSVQFSSVQLLSRV